MNAAVLFEALSDRYKLVRELGAGGMATVYLAADLKHDRKVAIKVLKPELAAVLGADRFVQEIKTTAALSHPHILPLFDSGTAEGFLYYVMPYLQGETIREKLNRETQFGIDEAVKLTTEVADALDYAHQNGVIHRDIKPENILLHNGRPMVMDFGIALAVSAAAGGRMTETGLSLGTPHYMSPEQATADKQITARSDIYSLASVLYEMLAGEPPHMGNSAQQIIMKIIAEPVQAVTALRRSVPQNVAAALNKALEKLPADRFESASAFAGALVNSHFTTGTAAIASGAPSQWIRSRYSRLAVGALGLTTASLIWNLVRGDRGTAESPSMIAFTLMDSAPGFFDVANDGAIAYVQSGKLYLRRPGETSATEVRGVERPVGPPVFSPDGRDIAIATEVVGRRGITVIVRVPTAGGVVAPLFTGTGGFPVAQAWSEDGWIYADEMPGGVDDSVRLVRFRETGGEREVVFRGPLLPITVLPGGRAIVGCMRGENGDRLIALALASGDTSHVADDACSVTWSPTGHLLATFGDGTLRAIPYDPVARRVTGTTVVVLSAVAFDIRLTHDGTLLYSQGPPARTAQLEYALITRDGQRTDLPIARGSLGLASFSPDGRAIAYTRDRALWVYDLNVGTNRRLSDGAFAPIWSPDGKRLAYAGINNGLKVRGVDTDTAEVTLDSSGVRYPTQWLRDGTILTSHAATSNLGMDVTAFRADSAGVGRTILGADWRETDARVSRDGRWIAYVSGEAGWGQLTVRTWPGLDQKSVIADSVATWGVHWSPDGNALYYRRGQRLMAASLSSGASRRATSHRVVADSVFRLADVHPDGERILVIRDLTVGNRFVRPLVGITGWLTELRRKVAAAGAR